MGSKACFNCFAPLAGGAVCPECGYDNASYRPQPHHLRPGTILRGHYVVGRALGQGGFGITYVGCDPSLGRRVAVKEYFPEGTAIRETARSASVGCYASESFQERYDAGLRKCMNEARALARLDDIPGIVRILEYFQENNTAYIIMEFVEGVTLATYLGRLPRRPGYREALALLAPIGAALEEVHSRGFVHRDVSPDNIMIDRKGRAKLLDFGAVKTVSEGGAATETPVVKRGFSPVEMYSTNELIGPWSDVYAYCATLYYILTGTAAPEPINRLQKDTLGESLSRVVSPAQTAALLKGLTIQPDQRYQTVAAMTAALTACRNDPAPVPGTNPAPVPATVVIANPAPRKTEPAPMPETEVIAKPVLKKTEPAPKRTERPVRAGDTDAPPDSNTAVPPAGRKKKKTGVIAVVAVLAALCVVIGVAVSLSSGKMSTTLSTKNAPVVTQAPSVKKPRSAEADKVTVKPIASADVGDYVAFGTYEQDNDTSNGKEDVEWLVLAKENGKALLISWYGLDCQPYNTEYTDVTWETCSLRAWLNGTFYHNAFSGTEQRRIVSAAVAADANPSYDTDPGNTTNDKIFLLSINKADRYLRSDSARQCRPTEYAIGNGAYEESSNGCCWWWLCSPGRVPSCAANVGLTGSINSPGFSVENATGAVRPALWIDLNG